MTKPMQTIKNIPRLQAKAKNKSMSKVTVTQDYGLGIGKHGKYKKGYWIRVEDNYGFADMMVVTREELIQILVHAEKALRKK